MQMHLHDMRHMRANGQFAQQIGHFMWMSVQIDHENGLFAPMCTPICHFKWQMGYVLVHVEGYGHW